MANPHYRTPPDLEQVRRRLYYIALNGEHRDSVNAARILLREDADTETGADPVLLEDLRRALSEGDR